VATGLLGSLAIAFALPAASLARATEAPVVAAASDLQFALLEVADHFEKRTGHGVRLTFGSSGNLARQIRQHAPFQVFFSANEDFVRDLAKDGLMGDPGELYSVGRLALFVPAGSSLEPDGTLADLAAAIADGRVRKLAIANPEHAPYGARAREALVRVGLWDAIKDKLVLGENASQAAQFATSGNAQGGIIAYSLALSPVVRAQGAYQLIPSDMHQPLRQAMGLTKKAGPVARAFYEFAKSPEARAIFRKHGFVLPDEAS
jgi:molybdate transport system substrate-binding protein